MVSGKSSHPFSSLVQRKSCALPHRLALLLFCRFHLPHHSPPQTCTNEVTSPGRWLVAQILKLLVAYITLHYDIQPLEERPLNTVFGDTNIPSMSAKIRVRRRKAA